MSAVSALLAQDAAPAQALCSPRCVFGDDDRAQWLHKLHTLQQACDSQGRRELNEGDSLPRARPLGGKHRFDTEGWSCRVAAKVMAGKALEDPHGAL